MLHEPADALVAAKRANEPAALVLRIAYCTQYTKEVETRHSILVSQFLFCAAEDLGNGERSGDGRGESDELL
jgi:hypothetical protein